MNGLLALNALLPVIDLAKVSLVLKNGNAPIVAIAGLRILTR
jgi:hypothetical protein